MTQEQIKAINDAMSFLVMATEEIKSTKEISPYVKQTMDQMIKAGVDWDIVKHWFTIIPTKETRE